jgi:hypothetical protein
MTNVKLTFAVHEGQGNSAKSIRAKYNLGKYKVVYTININGSETSQSYIVSGDINGSIVDIEAIHLNVPNDQQQCDIMKAFVKFLIIDYPNKEFHISASVLSDRRHLLTMFTSKEFKQEQKFKERVEYVSKDVVIRPSKPVSILSMQSTEHLLLGMIRLH